MKTTDKPETIEELKKKVQLYVIKNDMKLIELATRNNIFGLKTQSKLVKK
jgi:hypothetical protein